jgi:hypothetical protein
LDTVALAVISWRIDDEIRAESIEEAERALDAIEATCDRSLPPIVLVDRDAMGCMDIRLGHALSSLHHVPADSNPPYMVTVGHNPNDHRETDFWYFTHHTPAIGRNLIDLAQARRGMRWFLEHGTLAPFLTWEEV